MPRFSSFSITKTSINQPFEWEELSAHRGSKPRGQLASAALPVLQSGVPQEVVPGSGEVHPSVVSPWMK